MHLCGARLPMTTTQLIGVLTLVGTLLVAGMFLGRLEQQVGEHQRRIERLEQNEHYLHGDTKSYIKE